MNPTRTTPPTLAPISLTPTADEPPDAPSAAQLRDHAFALVDVLEAEHKAGADVGFARGRLLAAITDLAGAAAKYDATREQARCWALLEQYAEEVVMRAKSGRVRVKWQGEHGTEPFGRRLARCVEAIARNSP